MTPSPQFIGVPPITSRMPKSHSARIEDHFAELTDPRRREVILGAALANTLEPASASQTRNELLVGTRSVSTTVGAWVEPKPVPSRGAVPVWPLVVVAIKAAWGARIPPNDAVVALTITLLS